MSIAPEGVLRGAGNVQELDPTDANPDNRRYTLTAQTGYVRAGYLKPGVTTVLAYAQGDSTINCTGLGNADGFLLPGEALPYDRANGTHLSFFEVTLTGSNTVVVGEVS